MIREYINGKWFGFPQGVAQTKGQNLYYPAVASNENGSIITVAFTHKNFTSDGRAMNTVEASTKEGAGGWAKPTIIGISGLRLSAPQVAMDGEGNTTVVWEDITESSNHWRVLTTRHSPGPWQFKQVLLCVDCSSPSLAVDKVGNAWIVWVAGGQVQSKRGATVPAQ